MAFLKRKEIKKHNGLIFIGDIVKRALVLAFCFFLILNISSVFGKPVITPLPEEDQVCFWQPIKTYKGAEAVFTQIDRVTQNTGNEYIRAMAKQSLLYSDYTDQLQIAYAVDGGKTIPGADGTYRECQYGCVFNLSYRNEQYHNICLNEICTEGQLAGTQTFCDPELGNDVYYTHGTWFCKNITRKAMECGQKAVCGAVTGGHSCVSVQAISSGNLSSGNSEFALVAPNDLSQPFFVAAYQNGKLIASKPISNMSAEKYVLKYGAVSDSQARSFAQSTGLMTMVASLNSQKTRDTAIVIRTTGSSAAARGINYSIVVTPTAPAKNKASPSNYRASGTAGTSNTTYWQPATTTTYKPKTTVSASRPVASATAKKTTAVSGTASSNRKLSTTTAKRTSAYRTTSTTAASTTTTTRKRYR